MDIRELLSNPVAVIMLFPFLPLIAPLAMLAMMKPAETNNLEEWIIEEDEQGRIHITVHRHVERG